MKKIPTIFLRDQKNMSRVTEERHPDCGWVFDGEGVATVKWDGTSCMIDGAGVWKRREVKNGHPIPSGFVTVDADEVTGKTVGWMLTGSGPEDRWHREALDQIPRGFGAGTFELLGPKVQGNPYGLEWHVFVHHGDARADLYFPSHLPATFREQVRSALIDSVSLGEGVEGVVWHHPDGRMAKIKSRDFGIDWKANGVLMP